MTGRLIADREQIAAFFREMFKHAPAGSFVSLRAFFDRGEEREGPAYRPFEAVPVDSGRLIERATACAAWAANKHERVVFCPPIATFKSADNAKAENLAAGLALSVECDVNAPAAVDFLTALLGLPTLVVKSGGLEADGAPKLHWHQRLRRPTRTEEEHAKLWMARQWACKLVGGDPSNNSLVHPIRWPGSWHRKAAPARMASIEWSNDVEIDLDHAFTVLFDEADRRGLIGEDSGSPGAGNPEKMASLDDVATWLNGIPNPISGLPDTWDTWNNVAMATYGATGGSAEGLAEFLKWSGKHPAYGGPIHQAYAAARWRHLHEHPPTKLGAGRLYYLYNEHWSDTGDSAGDGDVIEGDLP
jgi:hypothetical protein